MKIKVFVHLNDLPGAFDVMGEQLTLASESGLLDAAEEVILCTNGKLNSFDGAREALAEYENVTFVHTSDTASNWEYPTLDLLHQECASVPEEECYICYFHLKGLSRPNDAKAVEWRQYLNYWTIERWEDNVKKLDEGMDTVGVDFIESPWPHYSGNFWWARASYIRKLEPLTEPSRLPWGSQSRLIDARLDQGNFRFEHEAWIGSGQPVWAELHAGPGKTTQGWHYKNNYPRENYAPAETGILAD